MKNTILVVFTLLTSGCAALYNPLPEGYTGPTAIISDSYSNKENTTAHYFILENVDQKQIDTSWGQTRIDNYGKGARFTPSIIDRKLLPNPQLLGITGLVFFSTDAQLIFGNDLEVKGEFEFTPKAGETYTVRGLVSESESKVWMEDSNGNRVSKEFSKNHDG